MKNKHAFTLIELLVVLAIIILLAGVLLPTIKMVRDSARSANCASNLRQIGMAISAYESDNESLPVYYVTTAVVPASWIASDPTCQWGAWWYHDNILGQYIDLKTSGTGLSSKIKQVVFCPSSKVAAGTPSYGLNIDIFKTPSGTPGTKWPTLNKISFKHPSSSTVAAVDSVERFSAGSTVIPPCYGSYDTDTLAFTSGMPNSMFNWRKRHNNGANALFFDWHVSFRSNLRNDSLSKELYFNFY